MGLVGNHDLCLLQEFRTSGVFPRFWTRMLSMPPPRAVDGDHHAASSAHRYSEGSDFPSATQHRGLAATARSQRGGTYLGRSGGTRELDRPTSRDDLCRSTLRLDCHDVRSIWSARRVVSGECSPGSCRLQRQYSRQPCRYSRLHVGMLPRSATRDLVLVAGILSLAFFWRHARARQVLAITFLLCISLLALPDSRDAKTYWSPYQKLTVVPIYDNGQVASYLLTTNNSRYQTIVNLSSQFVQSHADEFRRHPLDENAYNMPYRFYPSPPSVLVLGSGMGND